MHETVLWVVADPARFQRQRSSPKDRQAAVCEADVHGQAIHVKTVLGDTMALLTEPGVCCGRTITGNDLEWLAAFQFLREIKQGIEQPRCHGVKFSVAVI